METILIVDDEKNYTRILAAILEDEGFETLTSNSGPEALDILSESDVDLVLTDMKMPAMDGIDLLERIKKKDADLPVIMMTAHGTVEKCDQFRLSENKRNISFSHVIIFKPIKSSDSHSI